MDAFSSVSSPSRKRAKTDISELVNLEKQTLQQHKEQKEAELEFKKKQHEDELELRKHELEVRKMEAENAKMQIQMMQQLLLNKLQLSKPKKKPGMFFFTADILRLLVGCS